MRNTGMVSVPREATREMIEAAKKAMDFPHQLHAVRNPQIIYEAMLKAAPVEQHQGEFVGYCRAENIERMRKGDLSGSMVENERSAPVERDDLVRETYNEGFSEGVRSAESGQHRFHADQEQGWLNSEARAALERKP